MADPGAAPSLDDLLRHGDQVRRLARQLISDVHAADDVVQDAWAAALRRPPRHGDNLPGFFAKIVRHALGQRARSEARRRRRERAAACGEARFAEAAADVVQRAEGHRELVDLVLKLPVPQRTLVVLHYLEGLEIDGLARRFELSADAVRAHLRRARDRLRSDLERADRRRRALVLVGAAEHAACVPLLTKVAVTCMAISLKTKVLLAAVAATAVAWCWLELAPAPDAPARSARASAGEPAVAASGIRAAAAAVAETPTGQRTIVDVDEPGRQVACRLTGLREDAPWTAVVEVTLQAVHTAAGRERREHQPLQPDAAGRFSLRVPAWLETATDFEVRFAAEDPFYLECDVRERAPTLAESQLVARDVYELRVQAVAVAKGRVVDTSGAPVAAASVQAFAMRDGLPQEPALAATSTSAAGDYVLQIPAATDVALVAVAMQEAGRSGNRLILRNGAIANVGSARLELLPACAQRTVRLGASEDVPTLVLEPSALVDGTVSMPDGSPAPDFGGLQLTYAADAVLQVPSLAIAWRRDGTCSPMQWAITDERGHFELHGDARQLGTLRAGPGPERPTMVPIERVVTAPAHVEFQLAGHRLRVQSSIDGAPASVSLLYGDERARAAMDTNARGEMTLLVPENRTFWLRTREPGCTVFEVSIDPGQPWPAVLEVALQRAVTAPVTVECEDANAMRQAVFDWQPIGLPERAPQQLERFREDGKPFRFELATGRYRLRITAPERAERRDTFLVASEREVEVPPAGITLRVPTAHGGRVRIEVKDARGLRVPGSVRLVDAAGRESAPLFRGRDDGSERAGVLLAAKASETRENLAVGSYELVFDLGARGVHRRRVEVRSGAVAELRVELP